jgi:hypothetical protein
MQKIKLSQILFMTIYHQVLSIFESENDSIRTIKAPYFEFIYKFVLKMQNELFKVKTITSKSLSKTN